LSSDNIGVPLLELRDRTRVGLKQLPGRGRPEHQRQVEGRLSPRENGQQVGDVPVRQRDRYILELVEPSVPQGVHLLRIAPRRFTLGKAHITAIREQPRTSGLAAAGQRRDLEASFIVGGRHEGGFESRQRRVVLSSKMMNHRSREESVG
jgi:hypothetical protein